MTRPLALSETARMAIAMMNGQRKERRKIQNTLNRPTSRSFLAAMNRCIIYPPLPHMPSMVERSK